MGASESPLVAACETVPPCFRRRYHCVSELTRGTRQVLVCELWQGTENLSPSRDEEHRWTGAWKDEWRVGVAEAEVTL